MLSRTARAPAQGPRFLGRVDDPVLGTEDRLIELSSAPAADITASASGTLTISSGRVSSVQGGEGAAATAALHVVASNAFTVTGIRGPQVTVKVPGSGEVSGRETKGGIVAAGMAHAKRAETVHLRLKLTSKGRLALRGGSLKVTLRVTLSPTGGTPRTKTVRGVKLAG